MYKPLWCVLLVAIISACTQNNLAIPIENSLPSDMTTNKAIKAQLANKSSTAKGIKQPQGDMATSAEIDECQQQGGSMSKQGLLGRDFCVVQFGDKGKTCTDGGDCQAGRCVSENASFDNQNGAITKGVCPSNNVPFGCYGTVNQGKFGGFLCVD